MFNFRSRLFNKKCLLKPSKNKSDENIAAIEDDYNTANMRREWQKTKKRKGSKKIVREILR